MTEKEFIKRIGKRIEEKREALGFSREQFAEKVKLTRMHVYRIETGQNSTSLIIFRRIAKVLNVSIGELINVE